MQRLTSQTVCSFSREFLVQRVSSNDDALAESFDEESEELDAFLDSFTVNKSVNKTTL